MKKKEKCLSDLIYEARASMKNPISYCGHHCSFCSYKLCGGCRSEYVGNSFKKACGGNCPNIICAQEKGLIGCYYCDDLIDCQIGFYSKANEYTAKAAALFIKKHGEKCFTKILDLFNNHLNQSVIINNPAN
jgi:hypothetical protein